MTPLDLVGRVLALMAASPIHRSWSVADIERLILPPIVSRQCMTVTEGSRIVAFGSWAFFGEEAEARFKARQTRIDDWSSGDRIYLVDAIAPHGHARALTSAIRAELRSQGHAGEPIHFRRTYADRPWRISRAVL